MPKLLMNHTYSSETHWLTGMTQKAPEEITLSRAARYGHHQAASYAVSSFAFHPMENIHKETGEAFALSDMQRSNARQRARDAIGRALARYSPNQQRSIIRHFGDTIHYIRRLRAQDSYRYQKCETPRLECVASLGYVLVEDTEVTLACAGDIAIWVNGALVFTPTTIDKPFTGDRGHLQAASTIASIPRSAVKTVVIHSAVSPPPPEPVHSIAGIGTAETDFAALEVHF